VENSEVQAAHIGTYARPIERCIFPVRGIHFGTVVGRRALQATVSVLESHRSDDSGPKVGRWPTSEGATVPKWIPLFPVMGGGFLGHVYFVSDVHSVLDSWNEESVRDDFEHCVGRDRDVECVDCCLHCIGA